jgi:DNA-binding transcriptional LysR family regulator
VHLSQSTVSQQIRRLEELVGKSLFERDIRTVTLTRDGDALQNYAARILDLMSEAVEHFRAPALSGHARLGLSEDFASAGLTGALVGFLRRNPEVELTIEIGMSGDLFRQLTRGGTTLSSPSACMVAAGDAWCEANPSFGVRERRRRR